MDLLQGMLQLWWSTLFSTAAAYQYQVNVKHATIVPPSRSLNLGKPKALINVMHHNEKKLSLAAPGHQENKKHEELYTY